MIEFFKRISMPRTRRALRSVLLGMVTGYAGLASAGYVTTFESGMDAIFSQTSFGSNTIDIRFNPTITVVDANLVSLESNQEFDSLSVLRGGLASNIVSIFFIDSIPFCGSPGNNIIGCGNSGNLIALKSSSAADPRIGANLMAHELGHNLDLDHLNGTNNNLMNPNINSFSLTAGSFLSSEQVAIIFATRPLPGNVLNNQIIQRDDLGYFIAITPFAVVSAVPEPQTWLMMGLGLLGIMAWVRRPRPMAWRTA